MEQTTRVNHHKSRPMSIRALALSVALYIRIHVLNSLVILALIAILAALVGRGAPDNKNAPIPGPQSQPQSQPIPAYGAVGPYVPTEGSTPPAATGTATAVATGTAMATGTAEPVPSMLATRIAHETAIAEFRAALATSVALTAAPTNTPGAPPIEPSATPMMGMLPGCGSASPYGPQTISCWRGVLNGELVDMGAGREGRDGDVTQGVITVHVQGQDGDDVYQTPNRVGAVRIGSVSSITDTMFTLSTAEQPTPQAFVFDLNTRQWVSP